MKKEDLAKEFAERDIRESLQKQNRAFVIFSEKTDPKIAKAILQEQRIDDYITGKMSPEQEQQFLNECRENKELREQAVLTAMMVKAIKTLGRL